MFFKPQLPLNPLIRVLNLRRGRHPMGYGWWFRPSHKMDQTGVYRIEMAIKSGKIWENDDSPMDLEISEV